ncbi:MAG: FmdB family zinc ribbon protein [Halothece sp.]
MPLYEFECDQCGVFEAWRAIALRDSAPSCPTCEGETQRIFSVPHFNLSSGGVFLKAKPTEEPKVEKREKEPSPPRLQSHKRDRPWMVGH